MDGIPQEQPTEKKPNILQELEFGVGGVMIGLLSFLLLLFTLNYFNTVSLSLVFPNQLGWLPHRQYSQQKPPAPVFNFTQKDVPPGASPTPIQSGPTPILPIPLSSPLVKGVSVYYRLSGVVEEIQAQENGDLSIKLRSSDGIVYPQSFILSPTQTIVSKKGKGLGGVALSDIKEGDKLELVYTVDLKTNQSLVSQLQIVEDAE